MKKLIILVLLTIPFFLFINTNYASATDSLEVTGDYSLEVTYDYSLDNNIELSEDYQNGYRQGYEDGFSHKNRIKIALWEHYYITFQELDTVYRFIFENFESTYGTVSQQDLTIIELKNKIFIPTFEGFLGSYLASIRQWVMGKNALSLSVEKTLIQSIMTRDSVNEITAFRTYLQENNIYGYFERASGLTDYQIGYNTGYNNGFNTAMKETTTKLMSSILILISPILLISVILQMLNKFKNDN